MAVDTTKSLRLTETPTEIVATLGLTPGEYRIENSTIPPQAGGVSFRIMFVAAAGLLEDFPPRGAHSLVPGAREDIGIEAGQKWYFWGPDGVTLVITPAEGGGSIGGTPPTIRLPTFTIDIYRVVPTADGVPETPTGGAWNLRAAQLTPPENWSATQRPLMAAQTEYTSRALIDPNTQDNIVTPIWQAARRVDLVGTITAVRPTAPLMGGGAAGEVTIGLQSHGITEDLLGGDSVSLRVLAGGTAGRLLGFDTQGDPAEVQQHSRLSDLDVPIYENDRVLGASGGALAWVAQPTIPDVPRVYVQGAAPSGSRLTRDTWAVTAEITGATGVVGIDGVTAYTRLRVGDWLQWNGTAWQFRGTTAVRYADVTTTAPGIMSAADKDKLDSIARGAEVNVQADWNISSTSDDGYIKNKPTIPAAPVQSNWTEATTTSLAHILNKPTSLADFDAPAYASNDGKVLGLESGALAWVGTGSHRIYIGTGFRTSPDTGEQIMFAGNVSGLTGYYDADGTTARTTAAPGDWARYNGTAWLYEGSGNTTYAAATRTVAGIMSAADKTKLDGIAEGADPNVQADWGVTDTNSAAFIKRKPTIPTIPGAVSSSANGLMTPTLLNKLNAIAEGAEVNVQSDWNISATGNDAFIKNKPTTIAAFDVPAYASNDGKVLGLSSGAPAWVDQPTIPDAEDPTRVVTTLPSSPADAEQVLIASATVTAAANVSGTPHSPATALFRGDVVQWDGDTSQWSYIGRVTEHYTAVGITGTTFGLMTVADKVKLNAIAEGAEVNVQSDWNITVTTNDGFIKNKPTTIAAFDVPAYANNNGKVLGLSSGAPAWVDQTQIPDAADPTRVVTALPSDPEAGEQAIAARDLTGLSNVRNADASTRTTLDVGDVVEWNESQQRWVYQGFVGRRYFNATTSTIGLMSAADKVKLDGIAAGSHANVQADWSITDTSSHAFIKNKPTIPTIPGAVSSSANGLMTPALLNKLNAIAAGAEVNVQADWNVSSGDAFIKNKPTIPAAQVPSDWDATTGVTRILNKPTIPTIPAVATTSNNGLMSSADRVKLTGIAAGAQVNVQANWTATTAATGAILNKPTIPTIPGAVSSSANGLMTPAMLTKLNSVAQGAEVNVRSDWDATSGIAVIEHKPTIPTHLHQLDVPSYGSNNDKVLGLSSGAPAWVDQPTVPGAVTDSASGLMTAAMLLKFNSIAQNAEVNVQSDWDITTTSNDAFIKNKPTIPTLLHQLDVPTYGGQNGKILSLSDGAPVWIDPPAGSGGSSFTPTQGNLYASVKAILVHNTNTGVSANDSLNQINIAAGGGSSFTPSKTNLYAAVKSILVHTGNAGVSGDDTNSEIDISGAGGSAFLPTPTNTDSGDSLIYFGWAMVGTGWLIRRLTLATGALASATAGAANYAAAWTGRGGLTYA